MFADTLREWRKKKGISQAELARHLGVAQQTVGKWERNIAMPGVETMNAIAAYFSVSVDYLLGNPERIYGNHNKIFGNHTPIDSGRHDPPQQEEEPSYYHDPEVAQLAQELKENPGLHVLFDASRGLKKESIEEVRKFIEFQKAKENGDF